MWLYSDYIGVKSDLVDVYSQEQDKENPHRWKGFIPHEDFYRLLTSVLDTSERKKDQQKSIWIHGPYGTGKTFAVFVLKHLLEDPLDDVREYLERYDLTRNLWPRLKNLREKGPYLVVYKSSSAHVTSSIRLFAEIQEAIKTKLLEKGFKHGFEHACLDTILEVLGGPKSTFDWNKAFDLHQYDRFEEFSSPEEVVKAIKQGDTSVAEKVAQLLDEEGFVRLNDPDKVKEGIEEVVKRNNLQGIFFIWDEFTDFFMNNIKLSDIQELAHASASIPWYMVLVTHKSPDILSGDKETMDKVLDRFHRIHLELRRVTAYQLAANALHVEDNLKDEWETRRETLWGQVQFANLVSHLFDDQQSKADDFKRLVPIHPYSAFLLSTISARFSSSQRTLFKFLGSDGPSGFRWFLSRYPGDEERFWVTPDILWDYFLGMKAEESELTDKVRNVVNYYRSREPDLTDEQISQLWKGIMLFIALSREVPGEQRLLPTKSNLKLAFRGTKIGQQLEEIIHKLNESEGRFITVVPRANDEMYEIPLYVIDGKKLGDIKKQLETTESFNQRIKETDEFGKLLANAFRLSQIPAKRCVLRTVSSQELRNRTANVQPQIKPYQIAVIVVACFTENELSQAQELCKQVAEKTEQTCFMVINNAFGENRWKRWLEQKALCRYCQDMQDIRNSHLYEGQAREQVDDWIRELQNGRHYVYFGAGKSRAVDGREGFEQWFKEVIDKVFPKGPEKISTLSTIYDDSFGREKFLIGLGQKKPNWQFQNLCNLFTNYEQAPNSYNEHPLGNMKNKIVDIFTNEQEVELRLLWEEMQKTPFGLFPSSVSAALMGFLLKDYCEGHYWSDGTSCYPVDPTKMAELLNQVLKERSGHDDILIRKMTPAAEKFCAIMRKAFNLSESDAQYPGPVRNAIRVKMQGIDYPLWALRYCEELDSSIRNFLLCVDIFLKDRGEEAETILQDSRLQTGNYSYPVNDTETRSQNGNCKQPRSVSEAVSLVLKQYDSLDELTSKVTPTVKLENFQRGMSAFIDSRVPELGETMRVTDTNIDSVVKRIKTLMQEEVWLWNEQAVEVKLADVQADLSILYGVNRLTGKSNANPQQAIEKFKDEWLPTKSKLPLLMLAIAGSGEIRQVIEVLCNLLEGQWPETETRLRIGNLLANKPADVREVIADQVGALKAWSKQNLGEELSDEDARQIISVLPDLSRETDEIKVRKQIVEACSRLVRTKLAREVKQFWNDLTASESPLEWSRSHRVPVRWTLEGPEFTNLFRVVDQAGEGAESELEEALSTMREKLEDIEKLKDNAWLDRRLVEVLIPDSADMIEEGEDIENLKDYLVNKLGKEVEYWPDRQTKAREVANSWIQALYNQKVYKRVTRNIEALPSSDIKALIKELAHDPAIGSKLLKILKNVKE